MDVYCSAARNEISVTPQADSTPIRLHYLAEGGANIVYRISFTDSRVRVPSLLQRKLLRLRKDKDMHSTMPQHRAFEENFQPLFPPENLIELSLIKISLDIYYGLNSALDRMEDSQNSRHPARYGDLLAVDQYGLLTTDMTPRDGEMLLELKPKWLAQSPSAPASAKRCRTCALRAQRAATGARTATDEQRFCPFSLIDDSIDERWSTAAMLTEDAQLLSWLAQEGRVFLKILWMHQLEFDPVGVLSCVEDKASDLAKAMTLRDCTLYLRASRIGVEARLGDLDLKRSERLSKWKTIEQKLIGEGWYTNTERQNWKTEEICLLAHANP